MDGPILVATDGSEAALGALRTAAALAERSGRAPVVVSVVEPIMLEGSILYALPGQAMAFAEQPEPEVRAMVREQLRAVGGGAAGWEVEVVIGSAPSTIARVAEEHDAAVVLVGLPRHSRLERFLSGDTAVDLVRLARVPVLAVRPGTAALPRCAVVAMDFSEYSHDAARTALPLLADGAELHLVHVA